MNSKRFLIVFILCAVCLVFGSIFWVSDEIYHDDQDRIRIPSEVNLSLVQSEEINNHFYMYLRSPAGSGCKNPNLLTASKIKSGLMTVDIEGRIIKAGNPDMATCAKVVTAEAQIPITSFLDAGGGEIIINLKGESNKYILKKDAQRVYLEPIDISNIVGNDLELTLTEFTN